MVDQFAAFADQPKDLSSSNGANGSNDVFDSEQRERESELIRDRMIARHNRAYRPSVMSPEYLASLPTTLAEKLRVTPEQEEEILYHYASTSSIPKTADLAGVGVDKVRAVVYNPQSQKHLVEIRDAMRISVISKIEETQTILLDALQDPQKLSQSSLTAISSVFQEISETQLALMTASRELAGSVATLADPSSLFTGDELEYMAFLRRRLSAPPGAGGPPALSADTREANDPMNGHEFVDVESVQSPFDPAITIDGIHTVEETTEEPFLQDGD